MPECRPGSDNPAAACGEFPRSTVERHAANKSGAVELRLETVPVSRSCPEIVDVYTLHPTRLRWSNRDRVRPGAR